MGQCIYSNVNVLPGPQIFATRLASSQVYQHPLRAHRSPRFDYGHFLRAASCYDDTPLCKRPITRANGSELIYNCVKLSPLPILFQSCTASSHHKVGMPRIRRRSNGASPFTALRTCPKPSARINVPCHPGSVGPQRFSRSANRLGQPTTPSNSQVQSADLSACSQVE